MTVQRALPGDWRPVRYAFVLQGGQALENPSPEREFDWSRCLGFQISFLAVDPRHADAVTENPPRVPIRLDDDIDWINYGEGGFYGGPFTKIKFRNPYPNAPLIVGLQYIVANTLGITPPYVGSEAMPPTRADFLNLKNWGFWSDYAVGETTLIGNSPWEIIDLDRSTPVPSPMTERQLIDRGRPVHHQPVKAEVMLSFYEKGAGPVAPEYYPLSAGVTAEFRPIEDGYIEEANRWGTSAISAARSLWIPLSPDNLVGNFYDHDIDEWISRFKVKIPRSGIIQRLVASWPNTYTFWDKMRGHANVFYEQVFVDPHLYKHARNEGIPERNP